MGWSGKHYRKCKARGLVSRGPALPDLLFPSISLSEPWPPGGDGVWEPLSTRGVTEATLVIAASSSSPRYASDLEQARPQTSGEEELQLQLALAMSREEAEKVRPAPPPHRGNSGGPAAGLELAWGGHWQR